MDHSGVPWLIPLNARFDTRNLPDLLSHVPGGNRYIWLDLVCVPQGDVDPVLSRVRKQEIGRQASIFGNTQYVIVWFNDYDSFGNLELWISWIVRRLYLRNSPFEEKGNCRCSEMSAALSDPDQKLCLTKVGPIAGVSRGAIPTRACLHEWFTSLWTLQEACMRPDMWLCDRGFRSLNLLDTDSSRRRHIGLDLLFALQSSFASKNRRKSALNNTTDRIPEHVDHLLALLTLTADQLRVDATLRPATILLFCDRRECKSRRAEAIMSVLGATQWYDKQETETSLVLDRYPLAFVNEVRRNFGSADFFKVQFLHFTAVNIVLQCLRDPRYQPRAIGSLLPFGTSHFVAIESTFEPPNRWSHASLDSWEIRLDGSVHILATSILASSKGKSRPEEASKIPIRAFIWDLHSTSARDVSHDGDVYQGIPDVEEVDLVTWVSQRNYVCYAICVVLERCDHNSTLWMSKGVLLREIRSGLLVKTGCFVIDHWESRQEIFPDSKDVNWVVL